MAEHGGMCDSKLLEAKRASRFQTANWENALGVCVANWTVGPQIWRLSSWGEPGSLQISEEESLKGQFG